MSSRARLVPVAEAAKHIGVQYKRPDLWLRREIRRRERSLGVQILVRVGDGAKRPTYRVNLARLRAYCPDLLAPGDGYAAALTGEVRRQGKRIDALDDRLDDIDGKLAAVGEALRRMQVLLVSDGR